jgi:DNA-binding NtrC family response regulator
MTSQMRVLVVDDDLPVLTGLRDFLEDEDFYVRALRSAEEVLEILRLERFNVAIIDIRLPRMDGNTLIMKAYEIDPEIKFIIYTGSVEYDLPGYLKEIGIGSENVFHKPLNDLGTIVDAIKRVITEGGQR